MFLHGKLDEDIYMQQSKGFSLMKGGLYVLTKKKYFYGLKQQSPKQWYKMFNLFMTTHDFKRSGYDSYVYFKKSDDGSFVYLL